MIELVPISPADFPMLISWAVSENFLLQWTGRTFKYPLDIKQLTEYYELTLGKNPLRLILKAVDGGGKHIGNITIDRVKSNKKEAALTCIIVGDEKYKGRGAGAKILNKACRIAFEELGMKKLYLNVFDFNLPAIRCYKKCGFMEVIRENIVFNEVQYVNVKMERCNSVL